MCSAADITTHRSVLELSDGARIACWTSSPRGAEAAVGLSPILMLHGNCEDHRDFDQVAPGLASHFPIIRPDSRGQGESTRGELPLTYERLAEDFVEVLDLLGVERTHVLGYSDGGIVGLLMARDHPDRVISLVTIGANLNPAGLDPTALRQIAAVERAATSPGVTELMRLMLEEPHIDPASLGTISCPVRIMTGEHDLVLQDHSRLIASSISGSVLEVVGDAGHGLAADAPGKVMASLYDTAMLGESFPG